MLGVPDDQCWSAELSCGHVLLLQSAPAAAPSGVIICPEHDNLAAIVATERWDHVRARRIAEADVSRRALAGATVVELPPLEGEAG